MDSLVAKFSAELSDIATKVCPHKSFDIIAHGLLTDIMEAHGFSVTRSAGGIDTCFVATWSHGQGGRTVGFCSEYDALPNIGHACGHNLIAASGVGGALTLKALMQEKNVSGTIMLLGTPAEEGAGGKVVMLEKGLFDPVDVCMMIHPGPGDMGVTDSSSLARIFCEIDWYGKPSHAAAAPWDGKNALDASVIAFQAIGLLRQQMEPSMRLHGVITNGGDAVNVIPDHTSANFLIRAPTGAQVTSLAKRVENIFHGAALCTDTSVEINLKMRYDDLVQNKVMGDRFIWYCQEGGLKVIKSQDMPADKQNISGSTDMGNVTHVKPGIHPMIPVGEGCTAAPHTHDFASYTWTPTAISNMHKAAIAMGMTGLDLLTDNALFEAAQQEFTAWQVSQLSP